MTFKFPLDTVRYTNDCVHWFLIVPGGELPKLAPRYCQDKKGNYWRRHFKEGGIQVWNSVTAQHIEMWKKDGLFLKEVG